MFLKRPLQLGKLRLWVYLSSPHFLCSQVSYKGSWILWKILGGGGGGGGGMKGHQA